tara:strand:+ start:738 stop:1373 length:636 start_codon:yes stop_codon:yes gene_type:complete
MNKYNIKWLGVSLIVVVGGTIIYLYKSNNKKEVVIEKPMISYTSYYNLTDVPEHYEHHQQKDGSVCETTPGGDVILVYNKDTQQFIYYSNHEIPYRYLEVVVRKYVLSYNCVDLYTDIKQSYMNAIKEYQEQEEMKKEDECIKKSQQIDDVFIQYKNYNTQQYKQNNKNQPIKQEYIQFKRGGTIHEYNEKKQPIKKVKPIGFGEYKNKVS